MYNILTEPLIRMNTSGGSRKKASLPEVYATLMAGRGGGLPAPSGRTSATHGTPSSYN